MLSMQEMQSTAGGRVVSLEEEELSRSVGLILKGRGVESSLWSGSLR